MRGLRVLVVDDEPPARRRLVTRLRRRPEVASVVEAVDGEEALAVLAAGGVDLLFLDVQMPSRSGLEVARAIGAQDLPATVFVTAFDRFAVDAFDLAAVDYLLKPYDDERFDAAFERALRRRESDALLAGREALRTLLDTIGAPSTDAEHVTVEKAGKLVLLALTEIDWVRAADNYVEVHARGETYLVRSTLQAIERRLTPPRFLRVHRSALVNVERVAEIRGSRSGEHVLCLRDGTRLPLSRRYRRSLPTF